MSLEMFIDFAAGGPPVSGAGGGGGAPVQGESLDQTYINTIPISAFTLGIQNPATLGSAGGGAGAGKAQFQALKFTKNVDKASTGLFTACATGSHFKAVRLFSRVSGAKSAFLIYEFNLVVITQIQPTSGDTTVQEEVQAIFGALQVSYAPQTSTGQLGTAVTALWNQVTNSTNPVIPGN